MTLVAAGRRPALSWRDVLVVAAGGLIGGIPGALVAAAALAYARRYSTSRLAGFALGALSLAAVATVATVVVSHPGPRPGFATKGPEAWLGLAGSVLAVVALVSIAAHERALSPPRAHPSTRFDVAAFAASVLTAVPMLDVLAAAFLIRALTISAPMRPGAADLVANLRSGVGYVRGAGAHAAATALYAPLAPMVAAATSGGTDVVVVLLSVGTVLAVARLALTFGGKHASLAAAAVAAVLPSMWGQQLPETLAALLVTLGLVFSMPVRPRRAAFAGVCLGAAALARPEAILLVPIAVAWQLLSIRGRAAKSVAALAVAAAVVLAPWELYVHRTFGTWAPTTSLGSVLAGSTVHAAQHGDTIGALNPQPAPPPGRDEAAADRSATDLAWRRLWTPRLPLVVGARILRGWDLWSPPSLRNGRELRGLGLPGGGPGVALEQTALVLAEWELVRRRRDWRRLLPLYAVPVAFTLVTAATFGDRELRAWTAPLVAVTAGLALARCWEWRKASLSGPEETGGGSAEAAASARSRTPSSSHPPAAASHARRGENPAVRRSPDRVDPRSRTSPG